MYCLTFGGDLYFPLADIARGTPERGTGKFILVHHHTGMEDWGFSWLVSGEEVL